MPVDVRTLPLYATTRDALVTTLAMADESFAAAEFSFDPESDYRRAEAAINATLLQFRALAVTTLRRIDEEIAGSGLVADLTDLATEAEEEAGRLDALAHTIEEVTGVLGKLTRVVAGIGGLPFLQGR